MNRAELEHYGYSVARDEIIAGGYVALQDDRLIAVCDTEDAAWSAAAKDIDSDSAGACPKCEKTNTAFHSGSTGCGLDVTVRECQSCGHQWDHT